MHSVVRMERSEVRSQRDPAGSEGGGGGETASPQLDLWGGINTCSHIGFCSYLERFTGKRRPPSLLLNFWGLKKSGFIVSSHFINLSAASESHMCADGRVFTSRNVDCWHTGNTQRTGGVRAGQRKRRRESWSLVKVDFSNTDILDFLLISTSELLKGFFTIYYYYFFLIFNLYKVLNFFSEEICFACILNRAWSRVLFERTWCTNVIRLQHFHEFKLKKKKVTWLMCAKYHLFSVWVKKKSKMTRDWEIKLQDAAWQMDIQHRVCRDARVQPSVTRRGS